MLCEGHQVERCRYLTENHRKVLVVRDVLYLGSDDSSRFLKKSLVTPVWVNLPQFVSYPVVFSHPESVQSRYSNVFVCSDVTCFETFLETALPALFWTRHRRRQGIPISGLLSRKFPARELTQAICNRLGTSINH